MEKKVFAVQLDDKSLETSASKLAEIKVSKSQKEVEKFGVVGINNKSSKGKVKKTTDIGYEKNIISTSRKAVKSNISYVDDYFDFSFKVNKKVQPEAEVVSEKEADIVSEAKICNAYVLTEEAKKIISIARAGSLFG